MSSSASLVFLAFVACVFLYLILTPQLLLPSTDLLFILDLAHLEMENTLLNMLGSRLLVSFGGKYLDAYITEATSTSKQEDEWQIVVPALNPDQLGPVFIEVFVGLF